MLYLPGTLWAGRPSPFWGPIGLNFLQREVCVNPNLCFTKTADQNHLYILQSHRQRGRVEIAERFGREHPEMSSRDPFELDTREKRHRRPHRPLALLQVGGQQEIHPLPEISWGKVLVCSWGCKEILSCNCRILYEIDLSRFLLMMLWCLIVRDLALGLLCSCMVYLDYINYCVLVDLLPIILV